MQDALEARVHSAADRERNQKIIRRRLVVLGITAVLMIALVVASLIWRDNTRLNNPRESISELITIGATVLWGWFAVFFWSMKITPHMCYRKYLREIARGLTRTVEGQVVRFDEHTSFREGLGFYAMIVNIGDLQEPEDERLLYWDARLARPAVAQGDSVRVLAHGNDIIGLETR